MEESIAQEVRILAGEIRGDIAALRGELVQRHGEIIRRLELHENRLSNHEIEDREFYRAVSTNAEALLKLSARVESVHEATASQEVQEVVKFFREASGWMKFNKFIGAFLLALLPIVIGAVVWLKFGSKP